jgi:signal transduction histidine kinase/ActR/RegA family two-component response regulator
VIRPGAVRLGGRAAWEAGVDVSVPIGDLAEVLAVAVPGPSLAETRRVVLETAARLTQARRAILFVADAAGRLLPGLSVEPSDAAGGVSPERREALAVRATRDSRVVVADVDLVEDAGPGWTALAAPLTLARDRVGVLYVEGDGMPVTAREACLLALLADRLFTAELHHARSESLEDVDEIAPPVLAAVRGDGPEPLSALVDVARTVLGAAAAALVLAEGEAGVRVAAACGIDPAAIAVRPGDGASSLSVDLVRRLGFRDARTLAIPGRTGESVAALHLLYRAVAPATTVEPLITAVAAAVLEIGRGREESRAQEHLGRTEKTRALAVLAGGVSHEFNNLLAIILGKTQLALQRGEPGDLRGDLAIIEQTAWRAADTVRRLQTFVAGRSDERVSAVEVDRLVRDVVTFTEPLWKDESEARGVSVEVRTELAAGSTVVGRVGELQEVLTNLVRNALDAMPYGGRITIATRSRAGLVELSVTDTGEGISPDDRSRIFDPFFTTRSPLRAGLGLSVVQGIAARHGGRIDVRTQPGRGTTLTLTLPESDPEATGITESPPPVAKGKGPTGSILVIEDEHHLRRLLLDTLYAAGHEVEGAGDGLDGIRRFTGGRHDLVITDLTMPGCSGLEVARTVKLQRPDTPVLMITGWGDLLDLDGMRERRVDHVLVKPFTMERVLGAVNDCLARRRPAV